MEMTGNLVVFYLPDLWTVSDKNGYGYTIKKLPFEAAFLSYALVSFGLLF